MDLNTEPESSPEDCEFCLTCNKAKRKTEAFNSSDVEQGQHCADKAKGISINPLSSKLHSFRQKLEGVKSLGSNECLEKKGLLQRMHSLSLLKSSKEKIPNTVSEVVDVCQCDDQGGDTRFRTWPERGRDKTCKSPKKISPEVVKEPIVNTPVHVDLVLDQLPIAYDPVSRQLRLLPPTKEECKEEEPFTNDKEAMGHKRQPSLLSNISSTGSEVHLPLMSLHSKTHSHTSLSSLSNYSSSTQQTNSLERSCQPPRFGLASFWQRAFTRKSDAEEESSAAAASWSLFSRTSFFQRSSRSGRSSCSSLNSGNSPTSTPRSVGSTGLILHSRPSFLPAKNPEEELHHQLLHHKLLEESQRRELDKMQARVLSQVKVYFTGNGL